jgi:hypothetical protein
MSGKPDKSNFTLLLGRQQGFRNSIGSKYQIGIIFINDFMDLPQVWMIRL